MISIIITLIFFLICNVAFAQINGGHRIDSVSTLSQITSPANGMEILCMCDSMPHAYVNGKWVTEEDSLHSVRIANSQGFQAALPQTDSIKTRSLNTAFIISTTRRQLVRYTVSIVATISLTTGQTGSVSLQSSPDNITYTEIGRFSNGNSGTLTIGLNLVNTQIGQVVGAIPAGYYVKLVPSGTATNTFVIGQESTF